MIKIQERPLSVEEALSLVRREDCGAVALFLGTVRNHHADKRVVKLSYTAFQEMAEKELLKIELDVKHRWPRIELYVAHRVGTLSPGEESVVIAASSPHRAEAFEACRLVIETLKRTVPIWKEEFYDSGKAWIGATEEEK